jgi:HSP20 family protein
VKASQEKNEHNGKPKIDVSLGLGGIFKGLGNLLEAAAQLAQNAEKLQEEGKPVGSTGTFGTPSGLQAVYGFSVRVGPQGQPVFEKFGNIREKPGKGPAVDEVREPIVDVLDEGDHLLVVAELPGTAEEAVRWEIRDDILILSAQSASRKYHKEMVLPARVDENRTTSSYQNGILELKLWKPTQ